MEKHEAYLILIAKYLKGDINAVEKQQLFGWLDTDPSNKAVFDQMQRVWVMSLNSEEQFTPDVDAAWTKFKGKAGLQPAATTKETKVVPIWKAPVWRVAAMLLLAVGVVLTLRLLFSAENVIQLQTASNEEKEFHLPDGSKVWLNRNTTLSYAEDFEAKERKVTLSGEAFFDVKKAEGKKFVILSQNARTEVVGTSFNVKAYEKEKVIVSVVTGRVAFSSEKNEEERIFLEPGFKGILEGEKKITREKIGNENIIAWKNNKISFENTNLKEVVSTLKDYFGQEIKVENPQILNCHFTGTFDNPEIKEVLEILTISINSSYQQKEGLYILEGQGCNN